MEPSLRPARQPAPPLGCRTTQRPRTFSPARVQQKRRFGSLDSATGEEQRQNSRWRSVAFRKTTLPNPRRRRPNGPVLPNRRFCCTQSTHSCARVEPPVPPHVNRKRPPAFRGRALFIPKTSPLKARPLSGRYLYWLGCFAKKSKRGGSSRMRWRASVISPALHSSSMFSKS